EAPRAITDESGFDVSGRYGWEVDGYERGYARDGAPIARPPAPPRRSRFGRPPPPPPFYPGSYSQAPPLMGGPGY
nr:hypothetical protein [Phenylobacterium sp.]